MLWSSHEAEPILKRATFRLHLGRPRGEDGVEREYFGTGFSSPGSHRPRHGARTTNSCGRPTVWRSQPATTSTGRRQVFEADHQGRTIDLTWNAGESSKKADIAVLWLARKPDSVTIEGLRVGYLSPALTRVARQKFFSDRAAVSLFSDPLIANVAGMAKGLG
jgi:hypothetical protein